MSSTDVELAAVDQSTSSELPFVTVIVPTYNRAAFLPYLFEALARQIYPASRMELIVVDNSSSDDTESVVEQWGTALPFEVRFYRKDNKGPAASRNHGAARARGEIFAFTDSDCVPVPDWLISGVRSFLPGVGIVCGPFVLKAREGPGWTSAQVEGVTSDIGIYPTANLIVRRSCFEAAHGFDERFGLYPWGDLVGGEDTDFAWRVKRTGQRAAFVPEMTVEHLVTPMSTTRWLLRPVIIQIIPSLLRTIPELRRMSLWKGYFMTKMHFYFHLAWLGALIAIAMHWPIAWLAVVPWLYSTRHALARARTPAKAAFAFAILHYWFALSSVVLIVASIRYRRLVL